MPILSLEIITVGIRSCRSELVRRAACAETWAFVILDVIRFSGGSCVWTFPGQKVRFWWHSSPDCSGPSLPCAVGALPHPAPRIVPVGLTRLVGGRTLQVLVGLVVVHWTLGSLQLQLPSLWYALDFPSKANWSHGVLSRNSQKPHVAPLQGHLQHFCQFAASSAPGAKTTACPVARGTWEWTGELSRCPLLPPIGHSPGVLEKGGEALMCVHEAPVPPSGLRAGSQNQIFLFFFLPFFPECITGYCPYQTKPFHQRFFNTLYFSFILLWNKPGNN